jgi:rSAM/selenodomain-associated transferase 2
MVMNKTISVIISALNEARNIEKTIRAVQKEPDVEIIVVDGGSEDETTDIAMGMGVKVIASERGRAAQMNAGANYASGEYLLFLHADSILPADYDYEVKRILEAEKVMAGAFHLGIDARGVGYRVVECLASFRSSFFSMPYGDQAIFLKKDVFMSVGGFPLLPIMEDFELIRILKKRGKVMISDKKIVTSARRWKRLGLVKTTVLNQMIIILYLLGVSPRKLVSIYKNA